MVHQFKVLNEQKLEQILVCYKARYSVYAIAKLMGVSKNTIKYHLTKMGVKIRGPKQARVQPKPLKKRK